MLKEAGNKVISSKMQMFGLSNEDIERIKEIFTRYEPIEEVLIYGSRAKGNFKPSSDIDLTLLGNIDLDLQQQIEFDLDDLLLPYKFDISNYSKITNPEFLNHIQRVGKTFFKKESG